MLRIKQYPDQSVIRDLLDYDEETGVFRWRRTRSKFLAGSVAGHARGPGYIGISISPYGALYAHRLAWIFVHGSIPPGYQVDHVDRNRSNNPIANLRLASHSQQQQNRGMRPDNTSGLKCAFFYRGKWIAKIGLNGKQVHLGSFDTAEQAHEAYRQAADRHFGDFANF